MNSHHRPNGTNACKGYLVLDTETTGLPRDYQAPASAIHNWPRLIQIAWIRYDDAGVSLGKQSLIIRPRGFTIPAAATAVHGITNEIARRQGYDLEIALGLLRETLEQVDWVVAHNANFDTKVVGAEYCRLGIPDPLPLKRTICTMQAATEFCRIPGSYGYKFPRLDELHFHLFRVKPQGCHDAGVDVEIAAKCFWELRRLGVL